MIKLLPYMPDWDQDPEGDDDMTVQVLFNDTIDSQYEDDEGEDE